MTLELPSQFKSTSSWVFHNPVRLHVGRGCRSALQSQLPKNFLVVTTRRGREQLATDSILGNLALREKTLWVDSVTENPSLEYLQSEANHLRACNFDAVVAFGGGSAIDAGKVLNLLLSRACRDYSLETLLQNPTLHATAQPRPLYALPTTAGTGSEVTPFATLWDQHNKIKLSLASPAMFPNTALVDAALTDSMPLAVTVSTGLDAINQAAESIWNKNANSITFEYACRALQLGFSALPKLAKGEGGEVERNQMAEASLLAGLAISHTRTALCHSISYPITAHFGMPHGLACAFTMPAVLRYNLKAEDGRFAHLSQLLTGSRDLQALQNCFDALHESLNVQKQVLKYIPSFPMLLALEKEMFTPGRADNSLRETTTLKDILLQSWEQ